MIAGMNLIIIDEKTDRNKLRLFFCIIVFCRIQILLSIKPILPAILYMLGYEIIKPFNVGV